MKHNNHLIDLNDCPVEIRDKIISLAKLIMEKPDIYKGACTGKIMATLFYEPSTRTQMSFQSAMLRLGGGIIGFDNPGNSSVSKGESLKDTAKTISGYSDIIVMRHNLEGAVKLAATASDCPIVNAGDGSHLHPTQTLTDLMTLCEEKGRLSDLHIGICGDLKNGRTVHSLVRAVCKYAGNTFSFISTDELKLPDYIKDELHEAGVEYREFTALQTALPELDVLYMTRIQKERFTNENEYEQQKSAFVLDLEKLKSAKSDLIVMHPLPRVNEIAEEVDGDPRAAYFKQANYGMYVRMALILTMLNYDIQMKPLFIGGHDCESLARRVKCANVDCIVNHEKSLKGSFVQTKAGIVCEYCEKIAENY
jgi:aspartate carbamoyltransferase catalytic subunit